jgi:sugar/nucleoside kinase (ribokinase family)
MSSSTPNAAADRARDYDVYGFGHALADVQVQVDDALLAQIGFAKGVMTLVDAPTQQRILAQLSDSAVTRCAGGSAANTIIGIAGMGGRAAFGGKVGRDELGSSCLDDFRALGVAFPAPPIPGQTGCCLVLITPDGQRTMLTHLGVATALGPDDVLAPWVARSKYVFVEGYLFSSPKAQAAARRAMTAAKDAGTRVAFSASDPMMVRDFRDDFRQLLQGTIDLLFCNLDEARELTGQSDPRDCVQALCRFGGSVALTLGAEGSLIAAGGQVWHIPGVACAVVDTTGAGDIYAAGVLFGATNGLTWEEAGRLGSHAAARVVAQMGARLQEKICPHEVVRCH